MFAGTQNLYLQPRDTVWAVFFPAEPKMNMHSRTARLTNFSEYLQICFAPSTTSQKEKLPLKFHLISLKC